MVLDLFESPPTEIESRHAHFARSRARAHCSMPYVPPHKRNGGGSRPASAAPSQRATPRSSACTYAPSGASLQQRLAAAAAVPCATATPGATTVGTCMRMCSEAESREREQYRELSSLEYRLGSTKHESRPKCNPDWTVKRFKRPDAGAPNPSAEELRPLPVLNDTVAYLLRLWQDRPEAAPLDRCSTGLDLCSARAELSCSPSGHRAAQVQLRLGPAARRDAGPVGPAAACA